MMRELLGWFFPEHRWWQRSAAPVGQLPLGKNIPVDLPKVARSWGGLVAQQVKVLAVTLDDLSSISRSHMGEGKNLLPKNILQVLHVPTNTHKGMNKYN